jgi:hypothetical protein
MHRVFLWDVTMLGGTVSMYSIGGAALILCVLTANLARKFFKKPDPNMTDTGKKLNLDVNVSEADELVELKASRVSDLNIDLVTSNPDPAA